MYSTSASELGDKIIFDIPHTGIFSLNSVSVINKSSAEEALVDKTQFSEEIIYLS